MKNGDTTNHNAAERPITGLSEAERTMKRSATTELSEVERTMKGSATTGLLETKHITKRISATECPEVCATAAESTMSETEAERVWRAKYEPVERAIVEAHERRVESRRHNQRKTEEARCRAVGDLMEATEGFATVWRRENWTLSKMVEWADGDIWTLQCLARFVRLTATRRIDRLCHTIRRPSYYDAENARRRTHSAARRIRRRTTLNPCPTREQILDAWLLIGKSHEATIRFGSLVADLECFLDNSLVFNDDGAIVGRHGGVKRWLQENIPALYLRYTTVMRYKAAAQKLRRITGLDDPIPAAVIVEPQDANAFVIERPSVEFSGADDIVIGPSDTDNSGTISVGSEQNMMTNFDTNAVFDGRNTGTARDDDVGLCCGRNKTWDATQRGKRTKLDTENGVNDSPNGMAGNRMTGMVERIGLCCGRDQSMGALDVHDGTGGVDNRDGADMADVHDGRNGVDGTVGVNDGTGGMDAYVKISMVGVRDGMRGVDNRGRKNLEAYMSAIARARGIWRGVLANMAGHGPTALVAQIDAHDIHDTATL